VDVSFSLSLAVFGVWVLVEMDVVGLLLNVDFIILITIITNIWLVVEEVVLWD
jgi:hypothetical protein